MIEGIFIIVSVAYIYVGIWTNIMLMKASLEVRKEQPRHDRAIEIIENLCSFSTFSTTMFKWPKLLYIIYFGGGNAKK